MVNNERRRRESYHRRKIQTAKNIIILSKKNLDRPTNMLMKRRIELQFEGFHPLHLCQCIIEYSQEPEQMGEFVRILQDRARAQLTDRPSVEAHFILANFNLENQHPLKADPPFQLYHFHRFLHCYSQIIFQVFSSD